MLKFYNTLSNKLESFSPLNSNRVTMYVCGPTVYDRPHIGNGRSTVVYDVLYRLLIQYYGKQNIIFVRNITDVDDKINTAAIKRKISIKNLTTEVIELFNYDMRELNCLEPNLEPRVTDHISEIIDMISKLIERGNAYFLNGHVYFSVDSFPDYHKLAGKDMDKMIAGSRVKITKDKKNPADFVLWKPTDDEDDISSIFDSPWGKGRPGWHIECSAMSTKYLGETFDIHGGGIDLIFPHHTNEIAQSRSCYPKSGYARYWIHNGFLKVEGQKMSKSLGNFITLDDLFEKGVEGETVRFVYLTTHYRKPLNWTHNSIIEAKKSLDSFYRILALYPKGSLEKAKINNDLLEALYDDLNTPKALSILHELAKTYNKATVIKEKLSIASQLYVSGRLVGLFFNSPQEWFHKNESLDESEITQLIGLRTKAKLEQNWAEADKIREQLKQMGIVLEDHKDGKTTWKKL
ncbi:MAG: cysteine--tRNA ligase [Rickettsiales bacterium]|nr:cysteine--tRNA ligase [Rickettsiales bacterium]